MGMTATPVFVQTPNITPVSFTNADSANTKKTLCTGGANGTKVTAVLASSTDTSNRLAQLWLTRSGTSYLLGSVNVLTLAGTDGATATANILSALLTAALPIDNDGQRYLFLKNASDSLQISFTTQVTTAKEVDVVCISGDF